MRKKKWKLVLAATVVGAVLVAQASIAQSDSDTTEGAAEEAATEEPREISESPVPIDLIQAEDFNALGNSADLTDNLKMLVPSYVGI